MKPCVLIPLKSGELNEREWSTLEYCGPVWVYKTYFHQIRAGTEDAEGNNVENNWILSKEFKSEQNEKDGLLPY